MSPQIKIGIIGGSGLDDPDILHNRQTKVVTTPFGDPSDALVVGSIDGVECVLLARHGRKHNIMPGKVNYRANIWALKQEGCTHILAATATGSLQEEIGRGDIVVLDSFIDRTQGRKQTFYDGEEGHPLGICHLQMEPCFNEATRRLVIQAADNLEIPVHRNGTVVTIEGPRFSSKAESNIYRSWGGHVINMTSVPEIVLAKEAGLLYASIALVTDYDCWKTTGEVVSVSDVLKTFSENCTKIKKIITSVVPKIAQAQWDNEITKLQETVKSSVM